MVETAHSRRYYNFVEYLSNIKQDYVASRFLLVLSQYQGLNLSFVDKDVRILETHEGSIHNIRLQLIKSSFKGFYDVLDKIAYFLNDYLSLRIPETQIDFHGMWYSDRKKKQISKRILEIANLKLCALYDIHGDFVDGPYKGLRNTRNALTHRFVSVRKQVHEENDYVMTEDALLRRTLELSRIVRNAVICLVSFVYEEEMKKLARIRDKGIPVRIQEIRDDSEAVRR